MSTRRQPRSQPQAPARRDAYLLRDQVKLLVAALAVVSVLAILLTILLSSPDEPPSTIQTWSREDPIGFLEAAVTELGGTSATAEYGPPYNHNGQGQHAAFLHPQRWLGVTHPIDTARDFVIAPLRTIPNPTLQAEISLFQTVSETSKLDGIESTESALAKLPRGRPVRIPPGRYENVDNMMRALLALAQRGGLEADLLKGKDYFEPDYTMPLLFMADGGVLQHRARPEHLPAGPWPVMNETGSFPGQPWLWPFAFWYQIPPFKSSENADLLVGLVVLALSLALILLPLIPGARSVPSVIPVHRLIWREHYRQLTLPPSRSSVESSEFDAPK